MSRVAGTTQRFSTGVGRVAASSETSSRVSTWIIDTEAALGSMPSVLAACPCESRSSNSTRSPFLSAK